MKVSELMFGDWVLHDGQPYQYYAPYLDENNEISDGVWLIDKRGNKWFVGVEDIKPVPLTEEIKEKNGFVPAQCNSIFDEMGCAILYGKYERLDEDKMLNLGDNLWPIKYVHELQHALRLCGINKEITL